MKLVFLTVIKVYWFFVPIERRRKCIFRKSCSHYVFEEIHSKGSLEGFIALRFRYKNCRSGFEIYKNQVTSEWNMILPNGSIIKEKEIATRLINNKI